jgi:hypothetical protein
VTTIAITTAGREMKKKIMSDNFTRTNREKPNIAITKSGK